MYSYCMSANMHFSLLPKTFRLLNRFSFLCLVFALQQVSVIIPLYLYLELLG